MGDRIIHWTTGDPRFLEEQQAKGGVASVCVHDRKGGRQRAGHRVKRLLQIS